MPSTWFQRLPPTFRQAERITGFEFVCFSLFLFTCLGGRVKWLGPRGKKKKENENGGWGKKQAKEKEGRQRGGQRKEKSPRLDSALKDKPEVATSDLRKNFKGMTTEATTTTVHTLHTRTVFPRSTTREACFPSWAPPHAVWIVSSGCGKGSWSQHKTSDHGFDLSVSLQVLPCSEARATTLQTYTTDQKEDASSNQNTSSECTFSGWWVSFSSTHKVFSTSHVLDTGRVKCHPNYMMSIFKLSNPVSGKIRPWHNQMIIGFGVTQQG